MYQLRRSILVSAVLVSTFIAVGVVLGGKTKRSPPLPDPPGSWTGPGDTVPQPSGGGIPCPGVCPTSFTNSGCDVVCDYQMFEDPEVPNIAAMCWFTWTGYWAKSFTFTYADWIAMDQQIQTGVIQPDQDGNVTICTPQVFNLQELYVLESRRISGDGPDGSCSNRFPIVEAEVWVLDGVHGGPPPHNEQPDCDKELLHTNAVFSFLLHCLAPPPDCTDAQVWITFNVECMRQAIAWWQTNFGDNCVGISANPFALQCDTWLFNVGMLTCQVYNPEH